MSRIAIYTIGNREDGMGHVQRCLTLADELRRRDQQVGFITLAGTPGLTRIEQRGFRVASHEPDRFGWMRDGGADLLVIDIAHGPSREMMELARRGFPRVVVISAAGYSPEVQP